jgi:hypothetical protein
MTKRKPRGGGLYHRREGYGAMKDAPVKTGVWRNENCTSRLPSTRLPDTCAMLVK